MIKDFFYSAIRTARMATTIIMIVASTNIKADEKKESKNKINSCVDLIKTEVPDLNPTRRRIEDVLKQEDSQITIAGWISEYEGTGSFLKSEIAEKERILKAKGKLEQFKKDKESGVKTVEDESIDKKISDLENDIRMANEELPSLRIEAQQSKSKYMTWLKKCSEKSEPNKIIQKAALNRYQELFPKKLSADKKIKKNVESRIKELSKPSIHATDPDTDGTQ